LWLQLQEVLFAPVGDAAEELDTARGWDPAPAYAYLERVLDRVAAHAQGLSDLVVGLDVITPPDLAGHNSNALRGDPYAGSAELDQHFFGRPLAAAPGQATPVPWLWRIGASTHPCSDLGSASSHLVAGRYRAGGVRRLLGRVRS
jgi:phytoene dehydrogenase-like protein